MADNAVQPGRVLAGRYRLESKLGEGGFGTIWRAEHLVLLAPVALKLIDREVGADEEALARFMREAQAAAALRSPHVVQILDYGIDEGLPYIAMELLEGETLSQRLSRVSRLSPLETTRVVTHVARAVGRAHDAGVIHRDLKPENVFIVQNEDAEIIKVLDFGVAKVDEAKLGPKGTRTRTGSLLGTPFYMSPEQAQGNKTVDARTDLWALGVIAFECLTGKRPFESEGLGDLVLHICVHPLPVPSEHAPVPEGFDEWFTRACARDPEQRFQSARELADSLRELIGGEARETLATLPDGETASGGRIRMTVSSPKPPPSEAAPAESRKPAATLGLFTTTQAPPPKPANRTALVIGVGGLALAIGMGAGFVVLSKRKPPEEPVVAEPVPAETASDGTETNPAPAEPGQPTLGDPTTSTVGDPAKEADEADAAASAKPSDAAAKPAAEKPSDGDKPEVKKKDAAAPALSADWGLTRPLDPIDPPASATPTAPPPPPPPAPPPAPPSEGQSGQ